MPMNPSFPACAGPPPLPTRGLAAVALLLGDRRHRPRFARRDPGRTAGRLRRPGRSPPCPPAASSSSPRPTAANGVARRATAPCRRRPASMRRPARPIAPLAPAFNAERFTDAAKTEKWFRRNCNDVVGRECTRRREGRRAGLAADPQALIRPTAHSRLETRDAIRTDPARVRRVVAGLAAALPLSRRWPTRRARRARRAAAARPTSRNARACHVAYPPGLLPAASWQRLMANLPRHFGTDASLDAATAQASCRAWLDAQRRHLQARARGAARGPHHPLGWFIARAPRGVRRHLETARRQERRQLRRLPHPCRPRRFQ